MEQNVILFDWLTFTCRYDSVNTVCDLLGLVHVTWEHMEKGRNGYRQRMCFENISILYDGAENMGICVDMTGKGCRAFESYSTRGWSALFSDLLYGLDEESINVTRLDVAFDDHIGLLDIDRLRDDTDEHMYVSRSRTWMVQYGSQGTTIYHGSAKSNMYIRIYDKAAEQGVDGHWIRVEMQMRDEIAVGYVRGLDDRDAGTQFRGVLHNYLRYVVDPGTDVNMSRWPMADYWETLLDGVAAVRVWSAPGLEYTIWRLQSYVIDQAGNALDCYLQIFGYEDLIRQLGKRCVKQVRKYEDLKRKYATYWRDKHDETN